MYPCISCRNIIKKKKSSYTKYAARKNRALAMIVLSVDPALLHLIGHPELEAYNLFSAGAKSYIPNIGVGTMGAPGAGAPLCFLIVT